jgi:hypothetical protein
MANATWPASVPEYCLTSDFSEKKIPRTRKFKPSVGEAFVTRRYSATPILYQMSIKMSVEQYQTLKEFRRTTLREGSLPFDWVDPIDHVTPITCRFMGEMKPTPSAGNVIVSFKLMRLP